MHCENDQPWKGSHLVKCFKTCLSILPLPMLWGAAMTAQTICSCSMHTTYQTTTLCLSLAYAHGNSNSNYITCFSDIW